MANEFIEKEVMKERTGANVTPIQVDIQSRFLLNPVNVEGVSVKSPSKIPVHENMFIETLGKIAKESEQLKINNEKNLIDIAMKNKDLEFEEKWATVNDKYGDRFEEYLKDYKEVINSKKSLILIILYFVSMEKRTFSDNVDIGYKDWGVKESVKRNQYYIKEQNDIALATLEQRRIIGAKYGLNDDEKAKENYTYMRDTIEHVAKLTGLSEEEKIVMLGKNVGGTEVARLNNRIMEIQNSSMTLEQKKIEIDKVIAYMDNEKIVNDLVDTTMKYYKGNDEKTAKEYLKVQFEGETKSVLKGIKSQIDEYQKEQKRIEKARIKSETAAQSFYRKQLKSSIKEKDRQIEKAMNNKDPYAFLKYKYGIDVSYQELSERDDLIDGITGRTGISYADKDNSMAFRFVPPEINTLDEFNDYMAENQFTGVERDKRVKSFAASSKIPLAVIDKAMTDPKYKEIYEESIYANNMRKKSKIGISDIKKDGLFKNWGDHNDNIDGLVNYYKSLSYSQVEAEEKAVEFMISKNLPELANTKNSNEKIEILYDFADNFDISDYKDDLTVIKEIKNSKHQRFVNFKTDNKETSKKINNKPNNNPTSRPNHK